MKTYWTVNVSYRLPGSQRKVLIDKIKETGMYEKTQAKNTKAEAEALAETLRRFGFTVEVNKSSDL